MGIRNIDRIRAMSLEELAPLLIKCYRTVDEYVDYLEIYRYRESYFSPSGRVFGDYEDAYEDCIKWLDNEYKRNG